MVLESKLVIGYRYGVNLLSPSKTPMSNLQFLTFLLIPLKQLMIMKLLRGAIATASNDHRLGANEAPALFQYLLRATD
jgi:glutamine synthetase type III